MSDDLEPDSSAELRDNLRVRIATLEADLRTSEVMRDRLEALEERAAIQYVEALELCRLEVAHLDVPKDQGSGYVAGLNAAEEAIRTLIERKAGTE